MTTATESESYWSERYLCDDTPWDVGYITTPLKEFIDKLTNKTQKILIPGAGNAYEAEYLHLHGFKKVFVVDLSDLPLQALKLRCPGFPSSHLIHGDFFDISANFDLIIEQTFFCALPRDRRQDYVRHCHNILKKGGRLAGVLFDDPLNDDHPPFGGSLDEYRELFMPFFKLLVMERCYNSIPPRMNREIFMHLEK